MLTQTIFPAIRMLLVLTALTGLLYPGLVTLAAVPFFPVQAAGSLIDVDGVIVGSALVGQANQDPRYFWPRPSAVNYMAGSNGAQLGSSGATNYGVTNGALLEIAQSRSADFRTTHGLAADAPVPPEMIFAAGSGLDPHISPAAALLQVDRVAAARSLNPTVVADLVTTYTAARQWGFLGEPRVNVLLLNLALDRLE